MKVYIPGDGSVEVSLRRMGNAPVAPAAVFVSSGFDDRLTVRIDKGEAKHDSINLSSVDGILDIALYGPDFDLGKLFDLNVVTISLPERPGRVWRSHRIKRPGNIIEIRLISHLLGD